MVLLSVSQYSVLVFLSMQGTFFRTENTQTHNKPQQTSHVDRGQFLAQG